MNFFFRLKRRLEQFEQEREIERAQIHQISPKRQPDIEVRLRKDRVCIFSKSFSNEIFNIYSGT